MNQTAFIDDTQTYRTATDRCTAYRIETEGGHRRITDGISNSLQWGHAVWQDSNNINRRRQYQMTRQHQEEDNSLLLSCSYNGMTYHQRISQQELFTIQHGIGQEELVNRYEEHLRDKMDNYLKQIEYDNYTVNVTTGDWKRVLKRLDELEEQVANMRTVSKITVEKVEL